MPDHVTNIHIIQALASDQKNISSLIICRLTHTDLKPENILFCSSDWEISYNARKVRLKMISLELSKMLKSHVFFLVF